MKKYLFVGYADYQGERWGRTFPFARALANRNEDVTLIVSERKFSLKPWRSFNIDGVSVICIPTILPLKIRASVLGYFSLNFIIRCLFALFNKFDVVYSDCGESPSAGWPCKINQTIYKSKYLSEYGDLLGKGGYYDTKPKWFKFFFGKFYLWSISFFRTSSDFVIVLSSSMKEYVHKYMKIDEDKIIIIPGGSQSDKIEYRSLPDTVKKIINLGYIGVDNLEFQGILPVLKCISQKFAGSFKVHLFGQKISNNLIIDNDLQDVVIEYGWIDVVKGQQIISDVDIFMLMRENLTIASMGWPNKLGDYLSFGRPVMISPYGDLELFVRENPDGFITVDRLNIHSISDQLQLIIDGHYNLHEMGQSNRIIAETKISWNARIMELFKYL